MDPIGQLPSMSFQVGRTSAGPGLARHALAEWLSTMPCPDRVAADAELVVSELATNAVMHADSAPIITASINDGRLRIEVHDDDRQPPRTRTLDGYGGWGLRFVAAVTDRWGWIPTSSGKLVWAELLC